MTEVISTIIICVAGVLTGMLMILLVWMIVTKVNITVTSENGHTVINITRGSETQIAVTKGEGSPAINIRTKENP